MRRRTFLSASLGSMSAIMAGCDRGQARLHSGTALAFGTIVRVAVVHASAALAQAAIDAALDQVHHVDELMSIHDARSQVWQLNAHGLVERPHADLLTVLRHAQALSALTRGAFDITVQPLWLAYKAAADGAGLPSAALRRQCCAMVGHRQVRFDEQQVRLMGQHTAITLNGLAQGYAADLALAAVRAHGIDHALLDTGEFAARGQRQDGQPWTLGIADPRDPGAVAATFHLDGRSLATSGDYAAFFTPDFVHHHIFDPATGASPTELASVSVLAPTAVLADGLSTAFMVTGARRAHALAASLKDVDVLTINKRGVVWRSPGFPCAV